MYHEKNPPLKPLSEALKMRSVILALVRKCGSRAMGRAQNISATATVINPHTGMKTSGRRSRSLFNNPSTVAIVFSIGRILPPHLLE
jgi:hypothetical protein